MIDENSQYSSLQPCTYARLPKYTSLMTNFSLQVQEGQEAVEVSISKIRVAIPCVSVCI